MPRLTYEQQAQVLKLVAEGQTQSCIAQAIGCSQQAISQMLAKYDDTTQVALKLLKAKALSNVEKWDRAATVAAKKGNHQAAKELVEAAIPELRPQSGGNHLGIAIQIGQPGQPLEPPKFAGESLNVSVIRAESGQIGHATPVLVSAETGESSR